MASLVKSGALVSSAVRRGVLYQVVRNHWNKDWKPAPYPSTPDERIAAAKKYGVHPKKYDVYPDDGLDGWGDYPKLPLISGDSRDPYYPWDYPESKRNFNEPIHIDNDFLSEDRVDVNFNPRVPLQEMVLYAVGAIGGSIALYYFLENFRFVHPKMPKQYPSPDVEHYSFEPAQ